MRRRLASLLAVLSLSSSGLTSGAARAQGADESTVLIEGNVKPAGIISGGGVPSRSGSKLASGLAEMMVTRNVGLRLHGYAQFTDPWLTESLLDLRATAVLAGIVVHLAPGEVVDPYFIGSAGGLVTIDNGAVRVSPQLTAAAGVNVFVGRTSFIHAEASWQIGNAVLGGISPNRNDLRVTAGVGIRFDIGL